MQRPRLRHHVWHFERGARRRIACASPCRKRRAARSLERRVPDRSRRGASGRPRHRCPRVRTRLSKRPHEESPSLSDLLQRRHRDPAAAHVIHGIPDRPERSSCRTHAFLSVEHPSDMPAGSTRTRHDHFGETRTATGHCLRDSGLTHMAVRGDSPIVIQWRGGHTDFKTTRGYLERGRVEARRIGPPLPPLPPELLAPQPPQRDPGGFAKVLPDGKTSPPNLPESLTILRPQRELNPCYRRERPVS
jgi:hypothetical protein